ncbi:unnamed protein product [Protopolystoma xenopodis]|uniref:Uncharacterized protein n=1 Tax=Protopolystoma xenopodis TaxID=117903 RepID=A0A3S5CH31_9PLAT|nr:unnamed protein product [Protopolystoma xenopodis]
MVFFRFEGTKATQVAGIPAGNTLRPSSLKVASSILAGQFKSSAVSHSDPRSELSVHQPQSEGAVISEDGTMYMKTPAVYFRRRQPPLTGDLIEQMVKLFIFYFLLNIFALQLPPNAPETGRVEAERSFPCMYALNSNNYVNNYSIIYSRKAYIWEKTITFRDTYNYFL